MRLATNNNNEHMLLHVSQNTFAFEAEGALSNLTTIYF